MKLGRVFSVSFSSLAFAFAFLKDCATQRPGWDASCDAQDGVFVLRT